MRILGALFIFLVAALLATKPADAETYSFGVVPQFEPRKLAAIWQPILRELEKRTGLKFVMAGSTEIPDFEKSFSRGEFDFAYMNPHQAMMAAREGVYIPIVKDGKRRLRGILVVHKDGPIKSPNDLGGLKIAFPSLKALGASLLIRADLVDKFNVKFESIYVKTHSSVYLNVALGSADAGGGVLSTLAQQKPEVRNLLRIIHSTTPVPSHPVTAHVRVPPRHREQVRQAFFDMSESEEGNKLLAKVPLKNVALPIRAEFEVFRSLKLERFFTDD